MASPSVGPVPVPFTFHELLARQRLAVGLTQQQVRDALVERGIDVTPQAVGQWERGSTPRSADIIHALEEVLDCPGEFTTALGIAATPSGESRLAAIERRLGAVESDLRALLVELRDRT